MIAGVGLLILLIHKTTVSTNVLAVKAPVTVITFPEIEHDYVFEAPPSIWTKHVTVVRVYYEGKVTVIVSDAVIAYEAYAVVAKLLSYLLLYSIWYVVIVLTTYESGVT